MKKIIMDYLVITGDTGDMLAERVREKISDGYTLVGSMSIGACGPSTIFAQAIIKHGYYLTTEGEFNDRI